MEFETQCFIATEMHYLLDCGSLVLNLPETAVKWGDTSLVKGINGSILIISCSCTWNSRHLIRGSLSTLLVLCGSRHLLKHC